jgi:HD-GYP domain-containing protein (c-di-GMP phosphodiesterase class II)
MSASQHSSKSRLALRSFHEICAVLNSSLNHREIRRRAIEAATVLLDAEAGSLLLRDDRTGDLYFEVAVGERGDRVREIRIEPGQGIAGHVAQTGKAVLVDDVQKHRRFYRQADAESGFVTRNMICVPVTARDRLLGVLQALNKKHGGRFNRGDLENGIALGHQVGVALENAQLYEDINRLFEGFIAASVQAIESRDPATSGHSHRVAAMTCGLARAVDRTDRGRYADLRFTDDQMKELRYAAVLHDFGKVGVPEAVLVKANKLYPGRMALIRARFEFIKRTVEVQVLRRKVELLSAPDRRGVHPLLADLDAGLADSLKGLDAMLARLEEYNHATVLPPGGIAELDEMLRRSYDSFAGPRPYLTTDEFSALSLTQGNLSVKERHAIEAHVTETYRYLCKIPWTSGLKNVPAIAYTHHEKLDGTGYPRRIAGDQIPVQARMIAIVDVYDALTAWDRPYKPAMPPCDALEVIHEQVGQGKLDGDLFDVFVNDRVHDRSTEASGPDM